MPTPPVAWLRRLTLAVLLCLPVLVVCTGTLEGGACTDGSDCPEGTFCNQASETGSPTCEIGCSGNSQCPEGQFCRLPDHVCSATCGADSECGLFGASACVDGQCHFTCTVPNDPNCPTHLRSCDAGLCIACVDDLECLDTNLICLGGECLAGCRSDGDCDSLQVCHPTDFQCIDVECVLDEHCPSGESCLSNNTCGPLPCGASAPSCGGECPIGEFCADAGGGGCACTGPPLTCGETLAPSCGGECGAGEICTGDVDGAPCACEFVVPDPVEACDPPGLPAALCVEGFCATGGTCSALSGGGCGCVDPPAARSGGGAGSGGPFFYGVAKNPSLSVDPPVTGESAEQRLAFDVTLGELETFRAVVSYPPGFGIDDFLALGPPHTQVGSYGFDFDGDGTVDLSVPLRALKSDAAYADITQRGIFVHGYNPLVELSAGPVLTATLPQGGDGSRATLVAGSDARRVVVLFAGLVTNPGSPGVYTLEGCFTSVDPDTDGADDAQGEPPRSFCDEFDVELSGADEAATLLVIDDDSIDNGSPPNHFSDADINDDLADVGVRTPLPAFAGAHVGSVLTLHTGEVGDEGWFALTAIPASWDAAGPHDGLRNFVGYPGQPPPHGVGVGLGAGDDPEERLDEIPGVMPLRATGLAGLVGLDVCAVAYDSDVSINYDPLEGSLKGANLGTLAFRVLEVRARGEGSSSSLPEVDVEVLEPVATCERELVLYADAPAPDSSSEPFDVVPPEPPPPGPGGTAQGLEDACGLGVELPLLLMAVAVVSRSRRWDRT